MLIEHEPQADGPVSETDGGVPGRQIQAGGSKQEEPRRKTQAGGPRQVATKAGRQVLCCRYR